MVGVSPAYGGRGRPDERRLARVAARQHGVVGVRQLAALGFGSRALERRVAAGRLHRVHRGVYAVGHPGLTLSGRALAAVLAVGSGAAASHETAAALHGLVAPSPAPCHVTASHSGQRGPRGIVLHRTRRPVQATTLAGVPTTTLPRTLLDLASTSARPTLERALREAQARRALDADALLAFLDESEGRPGVRALRAALRDDAPVRSVLERRFLALVARCGLAHPEVNVRIEGIEVDFLWRRARLAVETDGFASHASRHGFERDRERDAHLARCGWRVLRFSWRQVTERPEMVLSALRPLLPAPP